MKRLAKFAEKSVGNVAGENALLNRNCAKFAEKSAGNVVGGNVAGGKTPCKIEIAQNLRNFYFARFFFPHNISCTFFCKFCTISI